MKRLCGVLLAVVVLTAAPFAALGRAQDKPFAALGRAQDRQENPAAAPSLVEIAAEAKRKKQESTRPVLTNDNLRAAAVESGPIQIQGLGQSQEPPSLAPFVPSPMHIVEAMLELARVREGDLVYDIGSGDGRIVIAAAELFGARAVGIEINEELVERSRRMVREKKLDGQVQIIHANALDVDVSPADVVTLYLSVGGNEVLRPHLENTLRPGTRVVSRDFRIEGWTLLEERDMVGSNLYLYRAP